MLAKLIPVLLLGACAATQPFSAPDQPALARLAEPYAQQLRDVGIARVFSAGNGAMVQLETSYGAVYVGFPRDAPPVAFVLEIGPDGLSAASTSFDHARDEAALAAILPVAIREVASNNTIQWIRANPWR